MSLLHNTNRRGTAFSQELAKAVLDDLRAGMDKASIARKYGISRMSVYRIIERGTPSEAGVTNDKRVYVRLAVSDYDALAKVAAERGETVSALSRRVLRRAGGFFDADREIAAAALKVSKELKKIGTNLNQVVYQINREAVLQGRGAPSNRHLQAIKDMQTSFARKAREVDQLLVRAGRVRLTTVAELIAKDED